MTHSIISWDCSYRNFFHLIHSLSNQQFDKNKYEFIFVEQRSQAHSDKYNEVHGLLSLSETVAKYQSKFDIKAFYLDHDKSIPYQLAHSVNFGLSKAKGEYISVMDGDVLVASDFLSKLEKQHKKKNSVINLYRHMAVHPCGVSNFNQWKQAQISIDECINACYTKYSKIPNKISNKGPLISAHREFWEKIEGYATDLFWATSASTAGADANVRLEIAANTKSTALRNSCCVHPWHPMGYARNSRITNATNYTNYIKLQQSCTQWSLTNIDSGLVNRKNFAAGLCEPHSELIKLIIDEEEKDIQSGSKQVSSVDVQLLRKDQGLNLATSNIFGLYTYRILQRLKYYEKNIM